MDSALLTLLLNNGYLIIFLLVFLYGPVITYAGGFLASLSLMNVWIVVLVTIFGNIIPDLVLFWIGKTSRTKTINKIADYLHLTAPRRKKIEKLLNKHIIKAVIIFKLIPGLAIPGMVLAGYSKPSTKKFTLISITYNIIAAIVFALLGFYSGIASTLFTTGKNLVIVLIVLVIVIYGLLKYFKNRVE